MATKVSPRFVLLKRGERPGKGKPRPMNFTLDPEDISDGETAATTTKLTSKRRLDNCSNGRPSPVKLHTSPAKMQVQTSPVKARGFRLADWIFRKDMLQGLSQSSVDEEQPDQSSNDLNSEEPLQNGTTVEGESNAGTSGFVEGFSCPIAFDEDLLSNDGDFVENLPESHDDVPNDIQQQSTSPDLVEDPESFPVASPKSNPLPVSESQEYFSASSQMSRGSTSSNGTVFHSPMGANSQANSGPLSSDRLSEVSSAICSSPPSGTLLPVLSFDQSPEPIDSGISSLGRQTSESVVAKWPFADCLAGLTQPPESQTAPPVDVPHHTKPNTIKKKNQVAGKRKEELRCTFPAEKPTKLKLVKKKKNGKAKSKSKATPENNSDNVHMLPDAGSPILDALLKQRIQINDPVANSETPAPSVESPTNPADSPIIEAVEVVSERSIVPQPVSELPVPIAPTPSTPQKQTDGENQQMDPTYGGTVRLILPEDPSQFPVAKDVLVPANDRNSPTAYIHKLGVSEISPILPQRRTRMGLKSPSIKLPSPYLTAKQMWTLQQTTKEERRATLNTAVTDVETEGLASKTTTPTKEAQSSTSLIAVDVVTETNMVLQPVSEPPVPVDPSPSTSKPDEEADRQEDHVDAMDVETAPLNHLENPTEARQPSIAQRSVMNDTEPDGEVIEITPKRKVVSADEEQNGRRKRRKVQRNLSLVPESRVEVVAEVNMESLEVAERTHPTVPSVVTDQLPIVTIAEAMESEESILRQQRIREWTKQRGTLSFSALLHVASSLLPAAFKLTPENVVQSAAKENPMEDGKTKIQDWVKARGPFSFRDILSVYRKVQTDG